MVGETLAPAPPDPGWPRIYLAGGIALRAGDGTTVGERAFAGRQARRLFVRLTAIHQPVSHLDLADDLWGTDWPAAWQVALRALVSRIRTNLARVGVSGAVASRDGTYEVRLPATCWLDMDVAREAIHRAETSLSLGDAAGAGGWALAARAIASRSLLPGEEGEWLDALREHLTGVRLRALECLADVWLVRDQPSLAARDAAEAISIDPFREPAHRLLIRAHLAAGDRGAAMRAFRSCEQRLWDELGVHPDPQTIALVSEGLGTLSR